MHAARINDIFGAGNNLGRAVQGNSRSCDLARNRNVALLCDVEGRLLLRWPNQESTACRVVWGNGLQRDWPPDHNLVFVELVRNCVSIGTSVRIGPPTIAEVQTKIRENRRCGKGDRSRGACCGLFPSSYANRLHCSMLPHPHEACQVDNRVLHACHCKGVRNSYPRSTAPLAPHNPWWGPCADRRQTPMAGFRNAGTGAFPRDTWQRMGLAACLQDHNISSIIAPYLIRDGSISPLPGLLEGETLQSQSNSSVKLPARSTANSLCPPFCLIWCSSSPAGHWIDSRDPSLKCVMWLPMSPRNDGTMAVIKGSGVGPIVAQNPHSSFKASLSGQLLDFLLTVHLTSRRRAHQSQRAVTDAIDAERRDTLVHGASGCWGGGHQSLTNRHPWLL